MGARVKTGTNTSPCGVTYYRKGGAGKKRSRRGAKFVLKARRGPNALLTRILVHMRI
jgi:hypothetical protein